MATPFIGQISIFGGNFAPAGHAMCQGQLLAISQNTALFSLLGTFYGGDGVSTFQLPDLRGRVPLHQGTSSFGTPYVIGEVLGSENVTLNSLQIPSHAHTARVSLNGSTDSPVGGYPAADPGGNVAQFFTGAANSQMSDVAIANTGGSQPHTNIQPFLAITFIIALFGVFPSRS